MYVCMYVCMHVCIYTYIYIYIYAYLLAIGDIISPSLQTFCTSVPVLYTFLVRGIIL